MAAHRDESRDPRALVARQSMGAFDAAGAGSGRSAGPAAAVHWTESSTLQRAAHRTGFRPTLCGTTFVGSAAGATRDAVSAIVFRATA